MSAYDLIVSKELFEPVWTGRHPNCKYKSQSFDRNNYKINDIIYFREHDANCNRPNKYTGRKITMRVNNVSDGVLEVTIIGLEQISIYQYVDSETYKKLQEENK